MASSNPIDGPVRSALASLGLLVLRVAFGGLMAVSHGWQKLSGFSEMSARFPDPLGVGSTPSLALAVGAEFFCSVLVVIGLATRLATVPLMTTMVVAAFIIHGADPLAKKEMALIYLAAFTTLLLTGPGRYSLDALWAGKRRRRKAISSQERAHSAPAS